MINLLKKDLRVSFNTDIKIIMKLIIGIMISSFILMPISYVTIPLFINYVFIFRSFHLDEKNKCDYFFNSMPIDKEDVVYSKYIFAMLIIIVSVVFTYLYNESKITWYRIHLNANMILLIINLSLLLVGICFPIIFKYGYTKSYIGINLIMILMMITGFYVSIMPRSSIEYINPIKEMIFNSTYLGTNIFNIILTCICIIIYIISMYISQRIYIKKEIAN